MTFEKLQLYENQRRISKRRGRSVLPSGHEIDMNLNIDDEINRKIAEGRRRAFERNRKPEDREQHSPPMLGERSLEDEESK
jgi:hypothetical protein